MDLEEISIMDVKGVIVKLLLSRYDSAPFEKTTTTNITIYIISCDEEFTDS